MTCASFIRLLAATFALFLVSGTMVVTPAAVKAKRAVSIGAGLSTDEPTTFVSAASPVQPDALCGPGCCCCNGPSSCGMAGGCAAHAIPPATYFALHALASGAMQFPASDVRTGRSTQSLERPPKA